MFCPLEHIEMRVETCPARSCIYKASGGACAYEKLTKEDVSVFDIAEVRAEKPYKIKSSAASGKQAIVTGVTISKYADYIRESFPSHGLQTVNEEQDTHVNRVLENTFRLTPHQHQYFWDSERFDSWRKRLKVSLTMQDIRQALLSASSV
jgi:hypothetical protein